MIKVKDHKIEKIILSYLGELSHITGVLKSGEPFQTVVREGDVTMEKESEKVVV